VLLQKGKNFIRRYVYYCFSGKNVGDNSNL